MSGKRWTEAEDRKLLALWGERSQRAVRAALPGRSWYAIVDRAKSHGCAIGAAGMQGYETVTAATVRTGYDRRALLRILTAHEVSFVHHRTSHEGSHILFVEVDAVDAAIAAEFRDFECIDDGARRHGLPRWLLLRWLRAAGEVPPAAPGRRPKNRVTPEATDRVVRDRGWLPGGESIADAARRHGMGGNAMQRLLSRAGLVRVRGRGLRAYVDPAAVDDLVSQRRAA